MNRLILKYKYPITFAILAVLAWVVYRYFSMGGGLLILFIVVAVLVWGLGTCVFLYFWPLYHVQCLQTSGSSHGLGGDPIPVNTLYAVPTLSSPSASNASLFATGTNDVLYVGGLLDLSKGPQVLHVPDMAWPLLQRAVH